MADAAGAPGGNAMPGGVGVDGANGIGGIRWLAQQAVRPPKEEQLQDMADVYYQRESDRREGQALLARIFPAVSEAVPGMAEQRHQSLVSQLSQISAIKPAPDNYFPYFDSNSLYSRSGDVHIGPTLEGPIGIEPGKLWRRLF